MALIYLGRQRSLGATRRVRVWQELLEAAGIDVVAIDLLRDHGRSVPRPPGPRSLLHADVVPESAMWSSATAAAELRRLDPDAAIFVTPRAFHPRLAEVPRVSVLDFQDRFSVSYRGRAVVDPRRVARIGWRLLATATERFERRDHHLRVVSAGFADAKILGATWIPNTVSLGLTSPIDSRDDAPYDLLFFGVLASLPNLDAVRTLADLWPWLVQERPSASCLIAGTNPHAEVRRLVAEHGWTLMEDFESVDLLCAQARIGIVPLRYANGIQNKLLEAAAAGLPQVVSPATLQGTAPGFPAVTASGPRETAEACAELLFDPARRRQLASAARDHIAEHYSVERWAQSVLDLVAP